MKKINNIDENFGQRLLMLVAERFKTQSEFADKLGKPVQSISRIINTDKASLEFLNEVVEVVPDLNLNWLLKGEGSMFVNEVSNSIVQTANDLDKTIPISERLLNLIASQQRTIENLSEAIKKKAAPGDNAKCVAAG